MHKSPAIRSLAVARKTILLQNAANKSLDNCGKRPPKLDQKKDIHQNPTASMGQQWNYEVKQLN